MFNFEHLLKLQYKFVGQIFNTIKSTLSEDACIVIPQTVGMKFLSNKKDV